MCARGAGRVLDCCGLWNASTKNELSVHFLHFGCRSHPVRPPEQGPVWKYLWQTPHRTQLIKAPEPLERGGADRRNAPKKPLTAYLLYCEHKRKKLGGAVPKGKDGGPARRRRLRARGGARHRRARRVRDGARAPRALPPSSHVQSSRRADNA